MKFTNFFRNISFALVVTCFLPGISHAGDFRPNCYHNWVTNQDVCERVDLTPGGQSLSEGSEIIKFGRKDRTQAVLLLTQDDVAAKKVVISPDTRCYIGCVGKKTLGEIGGTRWVQIKDIGIVSIMGIYDHNYHCQPFGEFLTRPDLDPSLISLCAEAFPDEGITEWRPEASTFYWMLHTEGRLKVDNVFGYAYHPDWAQGPQSVLGM